jgi:hypothetical protein
MVLYSRYKTWSFGPGYLLEGKDLPRILRPCQGQSKIILIDVGQGVWVFVDHADGVCRTGGYTQSATDTFLQGNDGDVVSHVDGLYLASVKTGFTTFTGLCIHRRIKIGLGD